MSLFDSASLPADDISVRSAIFVAIVWRDTDIKKIKSWYVSTGDLYCYPTLQSYNFDSVQNKSH